MARKYDFVLIDNIVIPAVEYGSKDFPQLYEYVYLDFVNFANNSNNAGTFPNLAGVKNINYVYTFPVAPFNGVIFQYTKNY